MRQTEKAFCCFDDQPRDELEIPSVRNKQRPPKAELNILLQKGETVFSPNCLARNRVESKIEHQGTAQEHRYRKEWPIQRGTDNAAGTPYKREREREES